MHSRKAKKWKDPKQLGGQFLKLCHTQGLNKQEAMQFMGGYHTVTSQVFIVGFLSAVGAWVGFRFLSNKLYEASESSQRLVKSSGYEIELVKRFNDLENGLSKNPEFHNQTYADEVRKKLANDIKGFMNDNVPSAILPIKGISVSADGAFQEPRYQEKAFKALKGLTEWEGGVFPPMLKPYEKGLELVGLNVWEKFKKEFAFRIEIFCKALEPGYVSGKNFEAYKHKVEEDNRLLENIEKTEKKARSYRNLSRASVAIALVCLGGAYVSRRKQRNV